MNEVVDYTFTHLPREYHVLKMLVVAWSVQVYHLPALADKKSD